MVASALLWSRLATLQPSGHSMNRMEPYILLAPLLVVLVGCTTTNAGAPMTRENVVELVEAETSPDTLGLSARTNGLAFPLNTENIVWLRENGVSDEQVEALLVAKGERLAGGRDQGGSGRQALSTGLNLVQAVAPLAEGVGSVVMVPISVASSVLSVFAQ